MMMNILQIKVYLILSGCYAKVINLDKHKEPEIFNAIFGSLLENVVVDSKRDLDFNDTYFTQNTGKLSIDYINIIPSVTTTQQI